MRKLRDGTCLFFPFDSFYLFDFQWFGFLLIRPFWVNSWKPTRIGKKENFAHVINIEWWCYYMKRCLYRPSRSKGEKWVWQRIKVSICVVHRFRRTARLTYINFRMIAIINLNQRIDSICDVSCGIFKIVRPARHDLTQSQFIAFRHLVLIITQFQFY